MSIGHVRVILEQIKSVPILITTHGSEYQWCKSDELVQNLGKDPILFIKIDSSSEPVYLFYYF